MKSLKMNIFLNLFNALCIFVIGGFFVFSVIIGGDAMTGHIENGVYYVSNHGQLTAVSETVWKISYLWAVLFWVFLPLTLIGQAIIISIGNKKQLCIKTHLSEKQFVERLKTLCVPQTPFSKGYEDKDCFILKTTGNRFRIGKHVKNVWRLDGYYSEFLYGKYDTDVYGNVIVMYRFAKPVMFLAPGFVVCALAIPIFAYLVYDSIVNFYLDWGGLAVSGLFSALGVYLLFGYSREYRKMLVGHLRKICNI